MNGFRARSLKALSCLAVILAGATMLSSTGAQAGNGPEVTGIPLPDSWILITKSKADSDDLSNAAGIQINTFGNFATPDINPISQASGQIVGPHEGFCDCTHFHGTILGVPDPDEKHCGWGCVIPVDFAPEQVVDISDALMLELRAGQKLFGEASDVEGAIEDLEESLELLESASDNPPKNGDEKWNKKETKKYKNALKNAIKNDEKAVDSLMESLDAEGPEAFRLIEKAGKAILKGLKQKRKVVAQLGDKLNLSDEHSEE